MKEKTIPVIYEDKSLCIVNKPCGIAVQGGAGVRVSLLDILEKQLNSAVFPVHRLDKQTAGLLIVAKSGTAAADCRKLFDGGLVEKEYAALCAGSCRTATECTVDAPVSDHGVLKNAVSTYRLLAGTDDYSLFSVKLHTGRMHQIRIHLAGIGHPIIGDDKYGNFALNKLVWKTHRIKKLQLCAYRLQLPLNGKKHTFSVPLPEHIAHAAEALLGTSCSELRI